MSFIRLDQPSLTFHPGFRDEQRLKFKVNLFGIDPVQLEVGAPVAPFSWSMTLPQGGLLTFPESTIEVEVAFNLPPTAPPVNGFITVYATDEDGLQLEGPPDRCELRGNVPGVGPGALSIVEMVPDPRDAAR